MPLPPPTPPPEPDIEQSKANIEAAVTAALAAGQDICEIVVPYDQAETLRAWVETEGMRCGCVIERPKKATLVINTRLAPPPPPPEPPAPPEPEPVPEGGV
jgi:hypothetical protein